jgi:hypothetical protein
MAGMGEKPKTRSGPYFLRGVEHGRHDDLRHFVPGSCDGIRLCRAPAGCACAFLILHDGCPRVHGLFAPRAPRASNPAARRARRDT